MSKPNVVIQFIDGCDEDPPDTGHLVVQVNGVWVDSILTDFETGKLKGNQLGGSTRNHWRITQSQLDEYLSTPDEPKGVSKPLELPPITKRMLKLKS